MSDRSWGNVWEPVFRQVPDHMIRTKGILFGEANKGIQWHTKFAFLFEYVLDVCDDDWGNCLVDVL